MVEEFLLSQSVALYPASVRPRSDSFANSSFPFFNSKLLSSLGDSDGTNVSPQSNATPLPDNGQRPVLRPAVSSPDIKALFNGAQSHRPYNNAPSQSNSTTSANTTSQFTSQPIEPVYQAKPAGHGLPELHTPRFHTPHGASTSGHTPSYSISSTFMPSHPTRLSEEMVIPSSSTTTTMSNKRESDPVMEAKIKDMIRRGALGHHLNARAQSLDISQQTKTFGRHASPSTDSEAVSAALSQLRL